MMKTNWSSTWPAIYQSPAAEMVRFACEGNSTQFIEKHLKTHRRGLAGEERGRRTEKDRKSKGGVVY